MKNTGKLNAVCSLTDDGCHSGGMTLHLRAESSTEVFSFGYIGGLFICLYAGGAAVQPGVSPALCGCGSNYQASDGARGQQVSALDQSQ